MKFRKQIQPEPPLFDIRAIDSGYTCFVTGVSGSWEKHVVEIPPKIPNKSLEDRYMDGDITYIQYLDQLKK